MCGLLALITDPSAEVTGDLVEEVSKASRLMRHRGPDEPGTWSDDHVVFGFNRLSIIDVEHSRISGSLDIGDVEIELNLETRGPEHCHEVTEALQRAGYTIVVER